MAKVYGSWPYNVLQLGAETTKGTPVAATAIWRGVFGFPEDDRTRNRVEETIGLMAAPERVYDSAYNALLEIPEVEATFEQLPYIMEASIGKVTSPIRDPSFPGTTGFPTNANTGNPTGADPYSYLYKVSVTNTPNDIRTYTLKAGNAIATADVKQVPFGHVREWELSGTAGEAWKVTSTWAGAQSASGSLTGGLSLATVEDILFNRTKLFLDASGGTIRTTQVSGVLLEASIRYQSNIMWVPVGDGALAYTAIKQGLPKIDISLKLELEQDTGASVVATERGHYESGATRLLALDCFGSTTPQRRLIILCPVKWDSVSPYEQEGEGNTSVTFTGHAAYDTTASLYFATVVCNNLSALV